MNKIVSIKEERRLKEQSVNKDNRINKSINHDDLIYAIDIQKWKIEQTHKIIDNKEKKKFLVTYVSFGVFTVLSGLVAALAAMMTKYGDQEIVTMGLSSTLIIIIAGANLINLTVIRYIGALKGDVLLAVRQLNCIRQSLHSMLHTLLEGSSPSKNFHLDKGEKEDGCITPYYEFIGSHIKYPMNNEELRDRYFKIRKDKDGKEKYKNDYKALYRSADLFSICCIGAFNLILTAVPVILAIYASNLNLDKNTTFVAGLISGVFAIFFIYVMRKIIKSFFSNVAKPLIPDGVK